MATHLRPSGAKTWSERVVGVIALAGLVTVAGLAGCANPDDAVGFHEQNPAARLRAVRQAAATGDREAIPDLIDLLESDDPAERVLAIRSLEKMTGQTLGYEHAGGLEERREAVRRWAAWYAQQPKQPMNAARTGDR